MHTAPSIYNVVPRTIGRMTPLAVARDNDHRRTPSHAIDLLRPALPESGQDVDVDYRYIPISKRPRVGGDFFDVFPLDSHHTAIIIGDVCGTGLQAAAQVVSVRENIRCLLYQELSQKLVATTLNAMLVKHHRLESFATAFIGVYDSETRSLVYCSCGHEPPFVLRANTGKVDELMTDGLPLGVLAEAEYTDFCTSLLPGDTLFLYTDGVSDALLRDVDDPSNSRFLSLIEQAKGQTAAELTQEVFMGICASCNESSRDDFCLLTVHVR